jgi:hypothetical protein
VFARRIPKYEKARFSYALGAAVFSGAALSEWHQLRAEQFQTRRARLSAKHTKRGNMNGIQKITIAAALWLATAAAFAQGSMQNSGPIATGTFHGQVHATSGRASIYKGMGGMFVLRLTNFKTSNGPDVHVLLIAAKDAEDNQNFLTSKTERVELGKLKGNEGDQNYEIPAGTDLGKFKTVAIYCERFNATFGAAPLEKF